MASSAVLTKDTLTQIALAGSGATAQLLVVSIMFYGGIGASEVGLYLDTNTTTPFASIPTPKQATIYMFPQLALSTNQKISAKSDAAGVVVTVSTMEK